MNTPREASRRSGWKTSLGISLFFLVVATGYYNSVSQSWNAYFQFNLFFHPAIALIGAAVFIFSLYQRLRRAVPGLNYNLFIAFVLIVFVSLARSFTLKYLPIKQSNLIAGWISIALLVLGIYFFRKLIPLIRGLAGDWRSWLAIACLLLWGLSLLLGLLLLIVQGGRDAVVLFAFHRFAGLLTVVISLLVAIPAGALTARRRATALGILGGGVIFGSLWLTVNGIGNLLHPVPELPAVDFSLSTIPYEKRPVEERDLPPKPIDYAWVAISQSCGQTADCHPRLLTDQAASIHNTNLRTHHLQKNLDMLATEIGGNNQYICMGCHAPVAMFRDAGSLASFTEKDSISCVFCHSIAAVRQGSDPRKSSYTLALPARHLDLFREAERNGGQLNRWTRWMVNINIGAHARVFKRDFYRRDEFCQVCHHLQLKGAVGKNTCVQCHMEPRHILGLEGKEKNHFFPGANTTIPELIGYPQWAKLNLDWLQGRFLIYVLADLYKQKDEQEWLLGDERLRKFFYLVMRAEFAAPPRAGEPASLRILTKNVGVAHDWPTSSLDLSEVWLEVRVTDREGRPVYSSGLVDEAQRVDPEAHKLGGHMIGHDNKIVQHNRVWQVKEKIVNRVIHDQEEIVDEYAFTLPADCGPRLNVAAEWRYRKLNHEFWTWAYSADQPIPSPVAGRTFTQFAVEPSVTAPAE
ncbi:MAG: hypothetical protein GX444_13925 [Myxococcales bacterium]|nr:hypothetical protein [Myxococcales bacterium]